MTYKVNVSQLLTREIEVEAKDENEAEEIANDKFNAGEFDLTKDDWCGTTEFECWGLGVE